MRRPIDSTLSLRYRLLGPMAALFLLGMAGLYYAAQAYASAAADTSFDRLISGSALSIAESLSAAGATVDVDIPYAALDMLSAAPDDRVFYRVTGPGDRLITGYSDLPAPPPAPPSSEPGLNAPQFFDASYRGETMRFVNLRRDIAQPGVQGTINVQVGQTRSARESLTQELVVRAVLPIALITILALAFIRVAIGGALRPLERLSRDLDARDPMDFRQVPTAVPAEIGPLVAALNIFIERSGANVRTLRAFIADAAHQMRTPLAALLAQAQVAQDGDVDDMRRGLGVIERNAARLSRLLNQLLSDATVIHRSEMLHAETFDLRDVIAQAIHDGVPRSSEVEIVLDWAGPAPVRGDPLMLGEAVKNLVDNALRYGDGETAIVIRIRRDENRTTLMVEDHGPGIPPTERAHLFERFTRGRSDAAGAGLGLAIVDRVVRAHGGSATLSDTAGGGLTVVIQLPDER